MEYDIHMNCKHKRKGFDEVLNLELIALGYTPRFLR